MTMSFPLVLSAGTTEVFCGEELYPELCRQAVLSLDRPHRRRHMLCAAQPHELSAGDHKTVNTVHQGCYSLQNLPRGQAWSSVYPPETHCEDPTRWQKALHVAGKQPVSGRCLRRTLVAVRSGTLVPSREDHTVRSGSYKRARAEGLRSALRRSLVGLDPRRDKDEQALRWSCWGGTCAFPGWQRRFITAHGKRSYPLLWDRPVRPLLRALAPLQWVVLGAAP